MSSARRQFPKISIRNSLLITLIGTIFSTSAYAIPLRILDCNGTTRGLKDVSPNTRNQVKIDANHLQGDVPNNTKVSLTNSETGEVVTAETGAGGVVQFEGVPPGDWIIGSTDATLVFSFVTIGEEISAVAAYGAAAGAGILGAGAVGGGLNAISNNGGNHSATPTPLPTTIPTPTAVPKPTSTPNDGCPDCKPDQTQKPIDDFFNSTQPQAQTQGQDSISRTGTTSDSLKQRGKQGSDCFIGDPVEPMSPFS